VRRDHAVLFSSVHSTRRRSNIKDKLRPNNRHMDTQFIAPAKAWTLLCVYGVAVTRLENGQVSIAGMGLHLFNQGDISIIMRS
jgi:hypothetical protein